MFLRLLLSLSLLAGCLPEKQRPTTDDSVPGDDSGPTDDRDQDGYTADDGDCDDLNSAIHPGAEESWYDGVDQDCDGGSDYDQDGDGVDSDAHGGADCLDTDPGVGPGFFEVAGDGLDNDCDGSVDEDTSSEDWDGDGVTPADGDCDDANAEVNPSAEEIWYDGVDQDCDGGSDFDQDGDGVDAVSGGGQDCDDLDPAVLPGGADTWYDGVDGDCDGASDYDQDGDGEDAAEYGGTDCLDTDPALNSAATEVWYDGVDQNCDGNDDDQDGDGVPLDADCDDTDAAVSPLAEERCDGVDNNCDTFVDDATAVDATTFYADTDGDSFGDATSALASCSAPLGYVADDSDCDDSDATVSPDAVEVCDDVDNDCDGSVDPSTSADAATWYADGDGDGYGDPASTTAACDLPSGYVADATDCGPSDAAVNPGADEICDSQDNDCDGDVDESGAVDGTATYADADGDGYGDAGDMTLECSVPTGRVTDDTDCDDAAAAVNPGATEVCNGGVDDDCDTVADDADSSVDASTKSTFYTDSDGDGYGSASSSVAACEAPSGTVADATDCDDASSADHPGATEAVNNGDDEDCDGKEACYVDADGDTYGTTSTVNSADMDCADSGEADDSEDCDDGDAAVNPAASELSYNGVDDDCDGMQDAMDASDETGWSVVGTTSSEAIGTWTILTAADSNNDGDDELLIGAPANDTTYTDGGAVSFHDSGTKGNPAKNSAAYLTIIANSAGDAVGTDFVEIGDTDGDNKEEFGIAGYLDDKEVTNAGIVWFVEPHSSTGAKKAQDIDQGALIGKSSSGYFGYSMAQGDVDGDGDTDTVVGAPGERSTAGRTYLYLAVDGWATAGDQNSEDADWRVRGVSSGDSLGSSVAVGEDLSGSGYGDVVTCGYLYDGGATDAGGCWIIAGAGTMTAGDSSVSGVDVAEFVGEASGDYMGQLPQSVATGDVDGDGTADLILGVPRWDGSATDGGAVAVFYGGALSGSYTVSDADILVEGSGWLGTAVWAEGDVSGDGVSDVLAGAPNLSSSTGTTWLIAGGGSAGTLSVPGDEYASWAGEKTGDYFGYSVGGFLDLDNDGTTDFAVGAVGNDEGASGAGKVYVLPAY